MAPKPVTLTFAGDAQALERTFDKVGRGAKDMAGDLDSASDQARRMGTSFDGVGDSLDRSEGKFMGTADLLDGLATTMGLPIDGAVGMARGFADLASGLKATVVPAVQQLWALMAANPILATVAVIAALTAAFVVAYNESETFRRIVDGVFRGIQQVVGDVIGWILDGFDKFLGGIASIAEAASHLPLVGDKFDGIAESIRGAQQDVRAMADGFHNMGVEADKAAKGGMTGLAGIMQKMGVSFVSPEFVGPLSATQRYSGARAAGGPVNVGGQYLVGERGPEMFVPNAPGRVTAAGTTTVVNNYVYALDPAQAATAVVRAIEEYEARNGLRFARTS